MEAATARRGRVPGRLRRRLIPYGLLGPGLLWLVIFFAVPMYFMARLALESGTLESGFSFTWEWGNFSDAISRYDEQFIRSFVYAGVSTLIALFIAYPLAYAIAFRGGRWKNVLLFAVVAPFFTTYLIRTIAWTTILSDNGLVVNTLQTVGILSADGRLLATPTAVIAGITYNFLPFMVLPLYASLERLDPRLIEAGRDLYSSPTQTFLRVTLPLTAPGIVAGTLLTFIPAAGDYINAIFLGSTNQSMVGNSIQSLYLSLRDYPTAAALSFILMAVIMVVVFIYIRFAGSEALMGDEEEVT
jgi:spermidine/putrescine transport system permease protein